MTALLDVVRELYLALPGIPVECRWRCRYRKRPARGGAADDRRHTLDLAQASVLTERNSLQEHVVVFAALLRSNLKDALRGRGDLADLLAFFDRESQRLLAVDVLAGLHRLDRDFGMPMIGRRDDHSFDVLTLQQFAIVGIEPRLAAGEFSVSLLRVSSIDVADRDKISKFLGATTVMSPLPSDANRTEDRTIVPRRGFSLVRNRGRSRHEVGN